ncbi:winged helix-turn-helix transcriptional regulator [Desertivirga brevis]|uniref:winged helix-turn-helix transcriptional regulator n=1 Tax=Desertivirga brevis TaxID=2810310 RepID=UPI001A960F86|nr:helix-turn-helix domain-containing protein [Pedobacter sp. SYSU D00873]
MNYEEFQKCGARVTLSLLAGKWKPLILFYLFTSSTRFTELWRIMPRVSKKVLLEQLKEMEEDGLIVRVEKNGFPPEVFYELSEQGKSLGPILRQLDEWGDKYIQAKG